MNGIQFIREVQSALPVIARELREYRDACGGCDHSVGVCQCELDRLVERVNGLEDAALSLVLPGSSAHS